MTPSKWAFQCAAQFYAYVKANVIDERLVELLTELYEDYIIDNTKHDTDNEIDLPEYQGRWAAEAVVDLLRHGPKPDIFCKGKHFSFTTFERVLHTQKIVPSHVSRWYRGSYLGVQLPDENRTEHMQVIASSGHGKTQLFQSLIVDELEEDAAIVVIDSQRDMINNLATRLPPERVILVDPETCPPALNIFARQANDEQTINTALAMYEYIFSALEAKLTSKQSLVYRMLARLCLRIPNANLSTLMRLLETEGVEPFAEYIDGMPDSAIAFFDEYRQKRNQYNETRQEVLRRVITVLEKETFAKMLNAPENRLNIRQALDDGKIILVSTNKALLGEAAGLFGRIFVAEVMQAVMQRKGNRKRVYLYIDEFADYAEDSPIMLDLFKQSRKYNCGLVIAHQELHDLSPALSSAVSANTAMKFVGRVSAEDRGTLARQIDVTADAFKVLNKGEYLAWINGKGTFPYWVEFGRLEAMPQQRRLSDIQRDMRELYGLRAVYEPPTVYRPYEVTPAPIVNVVKHVHPPAIIDMTAEKTPRKPTRQLPRPNTIEYDDPEDEW